VSDPPAELVVTNLHKAFGQQTVLTGVDFVVPGGDFAAVLGPSGSGKTTLLRIIAGFDRPDGGAISIGGTEVDGPSGHVHPEDRRIGYVSQEGSLFPHLNVRANVAFGLPRRERRGSSVDSLLDTVGLGGLGARYPHELSGGQQQRVALARALAIRPRLVLFDEPFASLDANLRASVRSDIREILREAGTTAVLVTHDQDEALSIADLVAVIREGTIAQLASPAELYSRPVDPDVAQFVGDANLIEGTYAGGMVETVFGPLTLAQGMDLVEGEPVTVLVRPEQVVVGEDVGDTGHHGRVMLIDYRGHDAVLRLAMETDVGRQVIVARTKGDMGLAIGARTTLTVRDHVRAWGIARGTD
jgi:iron(III) transport system ATP-binding protein